MRAGQAFVAEYVAAQEERYHEQYGYDPKPRLREDWKSAARVQWVQQTRGGEGPCGDAGAAVTAD